MANQPAESPNGAASPRAETPRQPLIAYHASSPSVRIVPAPRAREWSARSSAKRCLPLTMGNQAGWVLLNPRSFTATWGGEAHPSSIEIEYDTGAPEGGQAASVFGYGVLTFAIPYLFRTPPGYNLLARGPANWPKDGASPLDGLIETDWAKVSFTMNWKMTRPGHPVRFEADEPYCMVLPQWRGDLESFAPEIRDIRTDPEAEDDATQWKMWIDERLAGQRQRFVAEQLGFPPPPFDQGYLKGVSPNGTPAPEHQTRLDLEPFADL